MHTYTATRLDFESTISIAVTMHDHKKRRCNGGGVQCTNTTALVPP